MWFTWWLACKSLATQKFLTRQELRTKVTSTLQALSKLCMSLEVQMLLSLVHSPHPTAPPSLTLNCSPLVSSLEPLAWEE